jgi:hypothetical protein
MGKFCSRLLIFTLKCIIISGASAFACFSQIYNSSVKEKFNFSENYILSEKIYLQSDRNAYVTGENIFFKAYYFLNGTFKKDSISRIVYVDLVDKNGQSQTSGKYPIENAMANGNLPIPQGLTSGYYTVYAYTKWMMNFDKDYLFSKKIYIINPDSEIEILKRNPSDDENIRLNFYSEGGYLSAGANNKLNKLKDKFQIETWLNKEIYHAREKVDIKLKTKTAFSNLQNTHISVSIAKSDFLSQDTSNISDYLDYSCKSHQLTGNVSANGHSEIVFRINSDSVQHSSEIVYLPETSGFIISGTILSSQTNKPIPNVNIYLSTLSDYIDVQNAVSKQDGKFYFLMNEKIKNSDFIIQPADMYLKDYKVILDKEFTSEYPSDDINILRENKYIKKFFEELLINYQIEKQYNPNPQTANKIPDYSKIFYGKADSSYSFRKFIDLPAFEEYFVEIFSRTKIVKGENGKQIKVSYLDNSAELNQFPLLLVDGIPIFDVDKFLSISPSEIDKVDIINNNYVIGKIIYGGIIFVYTKKRNFAGLIDTKNLTFSEFKGYSEKHKFEEFNYTDEMAFNSRKADYRNTLYWNPEVKTDENGEANISFYTSDEKGKFLITIEGVGERGEVCSKKIILEVE